ncbi:MAG: hypothetical protein MRZ79_04915 [Bacteroidia bacterium]|nr:hypothetical protein [Bacteroidia bacterium]
MKRNFLLLASLLLLSNLVHAQRGRNGLEANQNQKAMATNEAQLERDMQELAAYKAKLNQFEEAFAVKNVAKIAILKKELEADMKREIEQSEMKIAQDKKELSQSKAEAAASGRESTRSRVDRRVPDNDRKDGRDVRDDRRDRKDDQRDAVDDRNDLERQIARTNRQKQIYSSLQAMTFSFEPAAYEKAVAKKVLFNEFATSMEQDIAATKAEIAEDKREAAEDRRERREDRRERGEKRRNRNW